MFIKSMNNLRGSVFSMCFVLVLLLLIGAGNSVADDLASNINKVLKKELEKEFGPLKDQIMYDKKEMWGRVISIDYQLPKDKRLDDTWGGRVVEALGRLGITVEYEGNEVRGEKQKIAGKEASTIQLTTQRTLEDPDAIAFTAMFSPES